MHALHIGTGFVPLPEPFTRSPALARPEPDPIPDVSGTVRELLARPTGGPPLAEFLGELRKLTVVIPDATRRVPVELVEAVLEALGERPFAVRVANGTHRRATADEQQAMLGRFFGQVPHGDRHADDPFAHRALPGIDARLDVQGAAAEALLLIGAVSFHYLAGFGGGGKLLAPGLADRRTAEWIHRACLGDSGRYPLAQPGVLAGNPLQERIDTICRHAPPQFYVQAVLDSRGRCVALFTGERTAAHGAAARFLLDHYGTPSRRHPSVLVSAGGAPWDLDFIQAHKALEVAAAVCEPGGTLVWLAECREGMPERHRAFLEAHADAASMERSLRARFDIAGHTVWAARLKAEHFRIRAVTSLPEAQVRALGMEPFSSLEAALQGLSADETLILPYGARFLPLPQPDA